MISICLPAYFGRGLRLLNWIAASMVITLCWHHVALGSEPKEIGRSLRTIAESVAWVAEVGSGMRERWKTGHIEIAHFEALAKKTPATDQPSLDACLMLYRAVALLAMKDEKDYFPLKGRLQAEGTFDPDLLLYEVGLLYNPPAPVGRRIAVWNSYAEYVPLSSYGTDRDYRMAPTPKIDPPLPSVPKLRGLSDRLTRIGELYAGAGCLREAVNAYVESAYAAPEDATNLEIAAKWTKIAQLEMAAGEQLLAVRAFLKAVYHDSSFTKATAVALERALAKHDEPKGDEPQLDRTTALAIAELYRESNLHPLALKVLASMPGQSRTEVGAQRKEIEREWASIVETHRRVRNAYGTLRGIRDACVLLGARTADIKNWGDVRVTKPSDTFWKPRTR